MTENHREVLTPKEQLTALRKQRHEESLAIALELIQRKETFSFPGMDPSSYAEAKAFESEYPELLTIPIDRILNLFRTQGMTIKVAKNDIFVVPAKNPHLAAGLLLRALHINDKMDPDLEKLIALSKKKI